MLLKTITGTADGTTVALRAGAETLTAFLTRLMFYSNPEMTSIFTTSSGTALLEYSSGGQVWHPFTGGRLDLSTERMIDPYANNSRILYIRVTFADVPDQPVYFSADFFLLGGNGPTVDPRVYAGLQAFTTQLFTEANVKNGTQFAASSYFTGLTAGETLDAIIITGGKPVIIKGQYVSIKDGGDVICDWYKNPEYTGGTNLTSQIFNQSDIAPVATSIQIIGGIPTNAAAGNYSPNDATKPVVTSVGTKVQPTLAVLGIVGQGSSSASRAAITGLDHILDKNSVYLYRRVFTSSTDAAFNYATWYEGPLSVDL